jgi:hypothetical protein
MVPQLWDAEMKGSLVHLTLPSALALVAVLAPLRADARSDQDMICSDGSLTIEYDRDLIKNRNGEEFPATISDRSIEWRDSDLRFSLDRSTGKLTIQGSEQTKFAQCTPRH